MATKSKNYKGVFWIKFLCVLLSALSAGNLALCWLYAYECGEDLIESNVSLKQPLKPFAESENFKRLVFADFYAIDVLAGENALHENLAVLKKEKGEAVEACLQDYITQKIGIIHDELYYVATHYDASDFEPEQDEPYTAVTQPVLATTLPSSEGNSAEPVTDAPTTTTPAIPVDERAPYNVRYCQNLLNTVTGRDLLQYKRLVRDEAFYEKSFYVDAYFQPYFEKRGLNYTSSCSAFTFENNEDVMRSALHFCFENAITCAESDYEQEIQLAKEQLDTKRVNFKYLYITGDNRKFTNMTPQEQNGKFIMSQTNTLICKGGKVQRTGCLSGIPVPENNIKENGTLYVYIPEPLLPGDAYEAESQLYYTFLEPFTPMQVLICAILSLLLGIVSLCVLLRLCGHKSGAEGITLSFMEKFPTDLHFLLFVGAGIGLVALFLILFECFADRHYQPLIYGFYQANVLRDSFAVNCAAVAGMALCAALFALVCLEWLTSTVRLKKAHESWCRHAILWRVPVFLYKCIKWVFRHLRKGAGRCRKGLVFLLGKPRKFRYTAIAVIGAFALLTFLVTLIGGFADEWAIPLLIVPLLCVLFGVLCVWYLRMLDRVIDASCDRSSLPVEGAAEMPEPLRTLAENLTVTSRELDTAVQNAVRNERTKTELITNVSHDLKTPLTAVISYVDLLKKCDIQDEKALGYLDILDEKSEKLKHLIEDLIEASKVNTGNVQLTPVPLNLSELAMQAVVENTPDFEKQDLDIRFTQPETAPIVHADSAKTYRILENLLSNAKKYSATGSRVYASVYEEGSFGVFELKNISREPLDMSPEELMERFVRGDRSRTEDGNGLGLSIAQQLCALQGGTLQISIDGDLFKAYVRLPKEETV